MLLWSVFLFDAILTIEDYVKFRKVPVPQASELWTLLEGPVYYLQWLVSVLYVVALIHM